MYKINYKVSLISLILFFSSSLLCQTYAETCNKVILAKALQDRCSKFPGGAGEIWNKPEAYIDLRLDLLCRGSQPLEIYNQDVTKACKVRLEPSRIDVKVESVKEVKEVEKIDIDGKRGR